jgi:prepilin-type N-terminal cleavage/methylation domain-containing protein
MKARSQSTRRQGGFTLVEMSVTLAAAGLLFAAVSTGQELIDQAKATKLINDVKSTEMRIQQYAQLKGRMPGDCNADGIIDYAADDNFTSSLRSDTANDDRAEEYGYNTTAPEMPAVGLAATTELMGCALQAAATSGVAISDVLVSLDNANVWINDMKLAGVISDSVPNRTFAKQVNEDFMFVGSVTDDGGATASGADYNAIVIHNVPQWMARRLATAINGQDAVANRSRVRLLDREVTSTDGEYAALWSSTDSTASSTTDSRDAMTTVVYFFDRIPSTS